MWQFLLGLLIGAIVGMTTLALCAASAGPEKYQKDGGKKMIEFCGNCQIGAMTHREEPGTCSYYAECPGKHCASWRPLEVPFTRERVAYICSPLRGDIEGNIRRAKEYCRAAVEAGVTPVAPHIYITTFMNDLNPDERRAGMEMGIVLLERCDEVWVFGTPTEGMAAEIKRAREISRPILFIPEKTVLELNERSNTSWT